MALVSLTVGLLGRRFFPKSYEQVETYAQAWLENNERSLQEIGKLWLVLGDSAAQGVGASAYDAGYVGTVQRWLTQTSGDPWRVLNLSKSGAKTRDVAEVQWPASVAAGVKPDLVTALVGGNDAGRTKAQQWKSDVDTLFAELPEGAIVGTIPGGSKRPTTVAINDHIRSVAAKHNLRVAELHAHTGPPFRGMYADPLHPNDKGYEQWSNALKETLSRPE